MTIYTAPATRSYQRPIGISGSVAIVSLLVIFVFSIFEPSGTSHTTNLVLAVLAGGIAVIALVVAVFLFPKEAMWRVEHCFEWELTPESLIQRHKNGKAVELPLNQISSMNENRGWLIVNGGEPLCRVAIPSGIERFDELKRELTSRCSVTPQRIRVKLLFLVPYLAGIVALIFLLISRERVVIVASGVTVLLWQVWAVNLYLRILRGSPIPRLFLLTFLLTFLVLGWIMFQRLKVSS